MFVALGRFCLVEALEDHECLEGDALDDENGHNDGYHVEREEEVEEDAFQGCSGGDTGPV